MSADLGKLWKFFLSVELHVGRVTPRTVVRLRSGSWPNLPPNNPSYPGHRFPRNSKSTDCVNRKDPHWLGRNQLAQKTHRRTVAEMWQARQQAPRLTVARVWLLCGLLALTDLALIFWAVG